MSTTTMAPPAEITASELVLPTAKVKATHQSPKNLIIFSKPKAGKTTLLSQLDNCFILDLENGSDYVDALKMKATSVKEIIEIGKAIKKAGKPYKYVAVDTITALEEMCVPYAEELYAKSSMGKNWFTKGKLEYGTILNMPQGAGYPWLKQAFTKVLEYIQTWADHVILVGHVKDVLLEKAGTDFTSADLDLTGKIKRSTASNSDAIGFLTRKGNQMILNFKSSDEVACGARPEHLRGQEIIISEELNGEQVYHWDRIFINN
jgi:energy-coupling factor transporter ATP-binding protein EcfA2